MPIGFSSMISFGNEDQLALLENLADEEEEDDRESKDTETSNFMEECIVAHPSDFAKGPFSASEIAFKNQSVIYIVLDVLTPPPRILQVI
ncbi:MAG: hypothetical protein JKY09_02350 [Crocinitomicaceae bacterium]|nr:hypothetical protein [Crocinitomicaceae bacterium]